MSRKKRTKSYINNGIGKRKSPNATDVKKDRLEKLGNSELPSIQDSTSFTRPEYDTKIDENGRVYECVLSKWIQTLTKTQWDDLIDCCRMGMTKGQIMAMFCFSDPRHLDESIAHKFRGMNANGSIVSLNLADLYAQSQVIDELEVRRSVRNLINSESPSAALSAAKYHLSIAHKIHDKVIVENTLEEKTERAINKILSVRGELDKQDDNNDTDNDDTEFLDPNYEELQKMEFDT